jgi:toxin-antitoxin system PIN domain toxin
VKVGLLDTNVLVALVWPNHQFHAAAHRWFGAEARHGWATCALTQLGFVRLSSNPAFTPRAVRPSDAAALLADLIRHKQHRFWPSPEARTPKVFLQALGHQQVNDAYLVALAQKQKGRLVTFDTRVPAHATDDDLVTVIRA